MTDHSGRTKCYDGTTGDPTVVAFDPGGVTGWAVLSVHPDALSTPRFNVMENITHHGFGQFTGDEFRQVDAMIALLADWEGAAVVTEQFILLQNNTSDSLLSPVRINAALRYGLHVATGGNPIKKRRRVLNQLPSLAKSTMTDERLAYGGFYEATKGMPHARDALRHAFTFMKRIKTQYPLRKDVFPTLA